MTSIHYHRLILSGRMAGEIHTLIARFPNSHIAIDWVKEMLASDQYDTRLDAKWRMIGSWKIDR